MPTTPMPAILLAMGIFSRTRDAIGTFESDIRDKEAQLVRLDDRIAAADAVVDKALAERRGLLIAGEGEADKALLTADKAAQAAQDRRAALVDARAHLVAQLDEQRARLDLERTAALRETIATALEARARKLEGTAGMSEAAAATFAKAVDEMVHAVETHGAVIAEAPASLAGWQVPQTAVAASVGGRFLARSVLAAAVRQAAPGIVPSEPPGAGSSSPSAGDVFRAKFVGPLVDYARRIRAGEASAELPRPIVRGVTAAAPVAHRRIVLAESIAYRSNGSREVLVSEGSAELPYSVARAALEGGYGHEPGSHRANAILAELSRPPRPAYNIDEKTGEAKPTKRVGGEPEIVRRGPPHRPTGVDIEALAREAENANG